MKTIKNRNKRIKELKGGSITNDEQFSRIIKLNHKIYGDIYTFDDKDYVSSAVKNGDIWEEDLCQKIAKYYKEGTDMLDIGAHIGLNPLRADQINKITGTVHFFEPQSDVFFLLNLNTQTLNRKLYNIALSDDYGTLSYSQDISNISATRIKNSNTNNKEKITTLCCKLDTFKFDNKISLIKIDIEENEIKVLKGAENTIKKHMPTIIVETFEQHYKTVEKFLLKLGYKLEETLSDSNYVFISK
jgi:FkbM family methyltransferase